MKDVDDATEPRVRGVSRRAFVASAARLGLAASTLSALDAVALQPARADGAARRSDIQFDVVRTGVAQVSSPGP